MTFTDERLMAERAMAAKGGEASPYPPTADRFREALAKVGVHVSELGRRCGVGSTEYQDVEIDDSEVFNCIDVDHLPIMASVLQTSVSRLLFGAEPEHAPEPIGYADVIARVREEAERRQIGLAQLGNLVGWDLEVNSADPASVGRLNLVGLYDICSVVGLDWLGVLRWAEQGGGRPTSGVGERRG